MTDDTDPTADTCLHPLPAPGLIRVAGAEASAFLQGQLTQDVRRIDATTTLRAACCNPKGRVLATLRLFARDQALWLWLPAERAAALAQRLKMYVLRAKVELSDVSPQFAALGVSGAGAGARLAGVLGVPVPEQADRALTHDGLTVLGLPAAPPRLAVIGDPARIDALQQALLAAGARAATAEAWAALDIAAGIAEVHGPLVEAFVPQMLNLDRTDGISFSKGCYTGQEIVARVHYLGQIKQRLYRAHVDAPAAPAVAAALIADQAGPNEQAGQIVSVAADPAGGWQMLAVVTTQLAARDAVRLADGTPLRLQPLHAGQDT